MRGQQYFQIFVFPHPYPLSDIFPSPCRKVPLMCYIKGLRRTLATSDRCSEMVIILGLGFGPQAQPFPMRIVSMGSIGPHTNKLSNSLFHHALSSHNASPSIGWSFANLSIQERLASKVLSLENMVEERICVLEKLPPLLGQESEVKGFQVFDQCFILKVWQCMISDFVPKFQVLLHAIFDQWLGNIFEDSLTQWTNILLLH